MNGLLSRVTTRDILAVITVAAALIFNGISLLTNRGPDAATMTLAGAVIGYYFKDSAAGVLSRDEELEAPSLPDGPQ